MLIYFTYFEIYTDSGYNLISSVYSEKNSKKLKEFKNAYDDNYVFGDYGQGDFPVIVSVSYYTSRDKFINAVIRITEPGTYEINVEKN